MLFDDRIPPRLSEEMKKADAQNAAIDFLLDMMLECDVPAEQKAGLRILQTAKQLHKEISALVNEYADPTKKVPYETAKQVNEYLSLVRTGIMQFKETITHNEKN